MPRCGPTIDCTEPSIAVGHPGRRAATSSALCRARSAEGASSAMDASVPVDRVLARRQRCGAHPLGRTRCSSHFNSG
jgi:hypothetical protein